MGKINVPRVIIGGIVTGIVFIVAEFIVEGLAMLVFRVSEKDMFVDVFGATMTGTRYHIVNILCLFAISVFVVWYYAAIRPRFGAGPGTALIAALSLWFFVLLLSVNFMNIGVWPVKLGVISLAFNLVELPAATLAGAAVYGEG